MVDIARVTRSTGLRYRQGSTLTTFAAMEPPSSTPTQRVRVWDLPTRCFHWVLAVCVIGCVVTAKIGGNALVWHMRLGLLVLALLAFRIVWGLVGGYWSRFMTFAYAPPAVMGYLRGGQGPQGRWAAGHSPVGALAVFAMLAVLAVQVATGLVADDEIATTGPLYRFVSSATALQATAWHKQWGQWVIIVLVALHLAAVAFYFFARRTNLVAPMWHGDKLLPGAVPASADGTGERIKALVVIAAAIGLAWWVGSLAQP